MSIDIIKEYHPTIAHTYSIGIYVKEHMYAYVDTVIFSLLSSKHMIPRIPKAKTVLGSTIHYTVDDHYCILLDDVRILITNSAQTVLYASFYLDWYNSIIEFSTTTDEANTDLNIVYKSEQFCIHTVNTQTGIHPTMVEHPS